MTVPTQPHILEQLSLPDRYETLAARLGPEVVQLLVPPEEPTSDAFERAALAVRTRGEGLLLPMYGRSGTGKTTLASNLGHFYPSTYTHGINHEGKISYDDLLGAAQYALRDARHNDTRILPIVIDHRESAPPTDIELAEIKRFLRASQLSARPVVLWPETNEEMARNLSDRYREITGPTPFPLPLVLSGPKPETWPDIAANTLRLANGLESLEDLGVDPRNYNPGDFRTIGDYLRQLSSDFDTIVFQLRKETRRPLSMTIVFVSSSQDPGVLTQLTSSSRYGLVDGHALISVTPDSELGKWWSARRGLLTRTIVQLNAHAVSLPPAPAVTILRHFGSGDLQKGLEDVGIRRQGSARVARDLGRSDFGKFLVGDVINAYESRGTPPDTATAAFELVAEQGFVYGKDRELNRAAGAAVEEFLRQRSLGFEKVTVEQQLEFCGLIPDNAIYSPSGVIGIEYTWRKGDFLASANRATVAQYILKKLRDYARQLGWTAD